MHGPSGEVAARHLHIENASDIVETSKCIPEIRGRGFSDGEIGRILDGNSLASFLKSRLLQLRSGEIDSILCFM